MTDEENKSEWAGVWQTVPHLPKDMPVLGWSEDHGYNLVDLYDINDINGIRHYFNGEMYVYVEIWTPLPKLPERT